MEDHFFVYHPEALVDRWDDKSTLATCCFGPDRVLAVVITPRQQRKFVEERYKLPHHIPPPSRQDFKHEATRELLSRIEFRSGRGSATLADVVARSQFQCLWEVARARGQRTRLHAHSSARLPCPSSTNLFTSLLLLSLRYLQPTEAVK